MASRNNRYVDLNREGLDGIMVKREAKVLDLVDLEMRRLAGQFVDALRRDLML